MTEVRTPAVAGVFYPDDPVRLESLVRGYVAAAAAGSLPAKAIVAPHAGYPYSGPVAGSAYGAVRHLAGTVTRVVLIGPAHRLGYAGIAVPTASTLATPLGDLPVDGPAVAALLTAGLVRSLDRAFDGEHALEVHLPFLRHLFGPVRVVPLLVGYDTDPEAVERVLLPVWGGAETLVVVSSDLSHYLDAESAQVTDAETAHDIEKLDWEALAPARACGHRAIAGLLRRARALDLRATCLDLRHSGDTAGGRDRVVGYGAFAFEAAATARLAEDDRERLRTAARQALRHAAGEDTPPPIDLMACPAALRAIRSSFVTLAVAGTLRGCIGTVNPVNPLIRDVVLNTARASRQDPRFAPITVAEAETATVAIAILSHPRPLAVPDPAALPAALRPGVDGVILRCGDRQALFLPKVWRHLPQPEAFLHQLKLKAGLDPTRPHPDLAVFTFTAEEF